MPLKATGTSIPHLIPLCQVIIPGHQRMVPGRSSAIILESTTVASSKKMQRELASNVEL